jgi:hypothetical protein
MPLSIIAIEDQVGRWAGGRVQEVRARSGAGGREPRAGSCRPPQEGPCAVNLGLNPSERVEGVAAEDLHHFLRSLAMNIPAVVHVEVLRGINAHHKVEGAFKALALALREAWSLEPGLAGPRSTKGTL